MNYMQVLTEEEQLTWDSVGSKNTSQAKESKVDIFSKTRTTNYFFFCSRPLYKNFQILSDTFKALLKAKVKQLSRDTNLGGWKGQEKCNF